MNISCIIIEYGWRINACICIRNKLSMQYTNATNHCFVHLNWIELSRVISTYILHTYDWQTLWACSVHRCSTKEKKPSAILLMCYVLCMGPAGDASFWCAHLTALDWLIHYTCWEDRYFGLLIAIISKVCLYYSYVSFEEISLCGLVW